MVRKSKYSILKSFLQTSVIFPIFKLSGCMSVVKCKLYILHKCSAIDSFVSFNMFTRILFIIDALLLPMLDIMSSISFLVLGDIKISMAQFDKSFKSMFSFGLNSRCNKTKKFVKLLAKYFGLASALTLIVNDRFWRYRLFSFQ